MMFQFTGYVKVDGNPTPDELESYLEKSIKIHIDNSDGNLNEYSKGSNLKDVYIQWSSLDYCKDEDD